MEEQHTNTAEQGDLGEPFRPMDETQLKAYFEEAGVVASGHFQLRSGRHSDKYVNKDVIPTDPALMFRVWAELCRAISDPEFPAFEVIVAPAVAGVVLASTVALQLGKPFAFAEKEVDKFKFRNTFANLLKGKQVLVMEDVLTTGGSVEKVLSAVRKVEGVPVGVQCIWNRSAIKVIEKVPVFSLITADVESWRQQECTLCQQKIPTTLLR